MDVWDSVIRMASALAIVLAVMMILVAAAKRLFGTRLLASTGDPLVQVLGSGYLGPRKSIALVSVAGELLILGTTQTDLIPLGHITDPEQIRLVLGRRDVQVKAEAKVESEELSVARNTEQDR